MGARTVDQLKDNLACTEYDIADESADRLTAVSVIDPGFPHDYFRQDGIRRLVFGNTEHPSVRP